MRSTKVTLPDHASISGILESSDNMYHVVGSQAIPAAGSPGQESFFNPTEIDDIYPGDGTILKRVKFARGLRPACVRDESYTFVSPREEDGKLQTIRGTVIH